MSHESTHRHTADQDDLHNHKHTGTSAFLNLSDRFFAPLDRHIVAWLQLAPGSRVLDAGCGGGGITRLLAQAVGAGGEVAGLDANPQLIEWGRSQVKDTDVAGQIQFQEGDVLHQSPRVHSCYTSQVADLPCGGQHLRLFLHVRKCFCEKTTCVRKIFVERLTPFIEPWARVTLRLFQIVQTLGLATDGRLGVRVTDRLSIQTSRTTILRRIMAQPTEPVGSVPQIGIDDFSFRRGCKFVWAKEQPPVFSPSIPYELGEKLFSTYLDDIPNSEGLEDLIQTGNSRVETNPFNMGQYIQEIEEFVGFVPH